MDETAGSCDTMAEHQGGLVGDTPEPNSPILDLAIKGDTEDIPPASVTILATVKFKENNRMRAPKRKRAQELTVQTADGDVADTENNSYEEEQKRLEAAEAANAARRKRTAERRTGYLASKAEKRVLGQEAENQCSPNSLVEKLKKKNKDNEDYCKALKSMSTERPTAEQLQQLQEASTFGPNYLTRTASLGAGCWHNVWKRGSNGFTTATLLMPAADTVEKQGLHDDISVMTQGDLVCMIGQHLLWLDIPEDEFLSYTRDPHFQIVHALNRYHERQDHVTIQMIDRRRAQDVRGRPTRFYPALSLYDIFRVKELGHWTTPRMDGLHARKFTQEYLTHHAVRVDDARFVQAYVKDLIAAGLYVIFPDFDVPDDHFRAGLYTGQVVFRAKGYPPGPTARQEGARYSYTDCAQHFPITEELLETVRNVTHKFMNTAGDEDPEAVEPHLHIFLVYLCFSKRPAKNMAFSSWIAARYTASDVVDLYDDGNGNVRPGFTHVADNLPGVMQYLDLVREAAAVFSLPQLPDNVLETRNAVTGDGYADEDHRLWTTKEYIPSTLYEPDLQSIRRQKAAARRAREYAAKQEKIKAAKDAKEASAAQAADAQSVDETRALTPSTDDDGLEASSPRPSLAEDQSAPEIASAAL